jgi:hypothetical protein
MVSEYIGLSHRNDDGDPSKVIFDALVKIIYCTTLMLDFSALKR